jgi:putative phosphoesterase
LTKIKASHNIPCWELVLRELQREEITTLVNCGDTVAPNVLVHMAETFSGMIHTVFGNNGDRAGEQSAVAHQTNLTHHGDVGGIVVAGVRIGFTHEREPAMAMVRTGEFDVVCFGHNHIKQWTKSGNCFVLNPGTAGGVFQYPSFATLDLPEMKARFIDLKF